MNRKEKEKEKESRNEKWEMRSERESTLYTSKEHKGQL